LISILFPFFFLPYALAAGSLLRPGCLLLRRPEKMTAGERQSEGLRKVLSACGSRKGRKSCRESRCRERDADYLREVMTDGRTWNDCLLFIGIEKGWGFENSSLPHPMTVKKDMLRKIWP
jgi:hypothetical protein